MLTSIEEYLIKNYLDIVIAILIKVTDPRIVETDICYTNSSSPVVLTRFCGLTGALYDYSPVSMSEFYLWQCVMWWLHPSG